MKISAGIVTFNPDLKRLNENLMAIKPQVDRVVCVDNGSVNLSEIQDLCDSIGNIKLIINEKNMGIAKALNQLLEDALKCEDYWMLTLDQDSVCPPDLIEKYRPYMKNKGIGILTPCIVDRNTINDLKQTESKIDAEVIKKCITSASLMRVGVWEKVGGFDDTMFIDLVDFDYCICMRKAGYKVVRVNKAKLLHQLGDTYIKRFFCIPLRVTNHSVFRNYYYARNAIYMFKKHHIVRFPIMLFERTFKVVLYEENKAEKIKAQWKGICDAFSMKVNRKNLIVKKDRSNEQTETVGLHLYTKL